MPNRAFHLVQSLGKSLGVGRAKGGGLLPIFHSRCYLEPADVTTYPFLTTTSTGVRVSFYSHQLRSGGGLFTHFPQPQLLKLSFINI